MAANFKKRRGKNNLARWKASFLTLPDEAFFNILRNYLGDFPTPFNKHQLMVNLENFLRRPEVRRGLISLVNEKDARILSAVQLLPSPGDEDLTAFFQDEPEDRDLSSSLLNLRDRLLIYLDRSAEKEVYRLNPYLEKELAAKILNPGRLFPSRDPDPINVPELPDTEDLLSHRADSPLPRLIPALKTLRLLLPKEDLLQPNREAEEEFAQLLPSARLYLLLCCGRQEELSPAWKKAEYLAALLPALGSSRVWTKRALILLDRLASQTLEEKPLLDREFLEDLQDFRILLPLGDQGFVPNPRLWGGSEIPSAAVLSPAKIPQSAPATASPEPSRDSTGGIFFPRPFSPPPLLLPLSPEKPVPEPDEAGIRKIREELLQHLRAAGLPDDQTGEIRERIRRGLIVLPEQIRPDLTRGERAEARGLDYNGKVLVIRQTLDHGFDQLEIHLHSLDGSPSRFRLQPRELRREGEDLILRGEKEPDGENWEMPVQKISLVRRLRSFLIR